MTFMETARHLGAALQQGLPKRWDGRRAILAMRQAGCRQWKQMEWIGFYFQFLCEKVLADAMTIPGPRYGNAAFDGLREVPWDFKAHAINTSAHQIIVNDSEAIARAIREYGGVGLILALGQVEYNDENRTFQAWHEHQKGGPSAYSQQRIKRGAWSRLRKVSFELRQVSFLRATDETLVKCGSFQTGFRNADGSPRRAKLLIDLEQADEETMHFIDF